MKIQFKGLKLGSIIITSRKTFNKSLKVTLEPKEIWGLFIKAIKEKKLIFCEGEDDRTNKLQR